MLPKFTMKEQSRERSLLTHFLVQDRNIVCMCLPVLLHVILLMYVCLCACLLRLHTLFHGWVALSAPGDPQTDTVGSVALWLTVDVHVCARVHVCVHARLGTKGINPTCQLHTHSLTHMDTWGPTIYNQTKYLLVCLFNLSKEMG